MVKNSLQISMSILVSTTIGNLFFFNSAFASEQNAAKVLMMRGKAIAVLTDGKTLDIKNDLEIPIGSEIQTSEKSFVKLLFVDKSEMNVGPSSKMQITAFPKEKAGIITLIKGQIRSKVTKDYMDIKDKENSKLFIKTATAALGVRGTDFQVNFNPINFNTALITFEGKVAMANIDKSRRQNNFEQRDLEKIVSSEKAVFVEKGMISAVNLNISERAMIPTALGFKQIEALRANETGLKESTSLGSASGSENKQYRNPIPPGGDGQLFSNNSLVAKNEQNNFSKSEASGFVDLKTGAYKLPAGTIIDLNTVNLVPPPNNAVFDPNSKTFIVPETYGKIDRTTGEYKSPDGLKLKDDGKFIIVDPEAYRKSLMIKKDDSAPTEKVRTPAENNQTNEPSKNAKGDLPPSMEAALPGINQLADHFAENKPLPPPGGVVINDSQKAIIDDKINQKEIVKENSTNTNSTSPNSNMHVIFN